MKIMNKIKIFSDRYLKNKCEVYVMYPEQQENQVMKASAYTIRINPSESIMPENLRVVFSKRLQNGEKCYFVEIDGKMIAYGWRSGIPKVDFFVYEVAVNMQLSTDAYILYDFWVAPEYRRKGIYRNMLSKMVEDIGTDGKSVIYAETNNVASRKAISNIGFLTCGKISFLRKRIII